MVLVLILIVSLIMRFMVMGLKEDWDKKLY